MKANTAVVVLVAGAAIGVGLGFLFAPDKGEITRQKLKEKAKKSADELGVSFDENMIKMKDRVDELIVDLEKRLEELRKYMKKNEHCKEELKTEAGEA